MKITFGKQRRFAEAAGVTPQILNDCLAGRRNASARVAKRIGDKAGCDPFIWMLPDNIPARREAVAKWEPEEKEETDGGGMTTGSESEEVDVTATGH